MAYTTIDKPSDYFNTKLYTGNGGTQSITGVGFAPNWSWIKNRTSAEGSGMFDTVRGVTKMLCSQNSDGESTTANSLTAFGSDGFSIGANNRVNQNSNNIVSWNWRGNSSGTSVSASGGVNGYNACTHYANQDAGFSIVKYTGRNSVLNNGQDTRVTHGLGVIPKIIIIKSLDTVQNWVVFHHYNWNGCHFNLNTDAGMNCHLYVGNNNNTTSSYFNVGNDNLANKNNDNFIAYVFAEKQGYSKFGAYKGNGNVSGTFCYLGFAAAFIMIKRTDGAADWEMYDNKRLGFNDDNPPLYANLNNAEGSNDRIDILAQGFKIRASSGNLGASGGTYIYMAFAENPFVTSTGVPATAR